MAVQQLRGRSSEAGNKILRCVSDAPVLRQGLGTESNELSPGDGITTKREEMNFFTCIKTRHASMRADVPCT